MNISLIPELRRIQEIVNSPYIQAIRKQQGELMRAIAPIMQTRRMLLSQIDFSFIVKVQKSFESITQTFYGLQFSTTITKNNQTETHTTQAFCQETTISQAEHIRILSERDYLISTQQTIIIQLQTKNNELLTENESLTYQIQHNSQDFKTKLSIQNSNNAKQKGYPELKKWILEIAEQPQIKNISKPSKQALEIERIIKFHSKEYNTVMQSKISKPINLHNYIKEVLKKQV